MLKLLQSCIHYTHSKVMLLNPSSQASTVCELPDVQFDFIDYAKAFDCVDHNKLWKILKEMGIPDHLTCLLRNLYAGQEATVRTGTKDWFQIGKGVRQGCILSHCLFNLHAEYIMQNDGLDEAQAGIKTKVKEESEKVGLKLNIQKTKIMASVPSLHG